LYEIKKERKKKKKKKTRKREARKRKKKKGIFDGKKNSNADKIKEKMIGEKQKMKFCWSEKEDQGALVFGK
jgi:hypothetical protein